MMYRYKNIAVNLNNIRTIQITESISRSATRWNITITYCDNNTVFISELEKEETEQLLDSMIREINGGK